MKAIAVRLGLAALATVTASLAQAQTIATSVAAGEFHNCAINGAGKVQCWGQGIYGQLGDGNTVGRTIPTEVAAVSNAVAVAVGARHSCALMMNGELKCWGQNGSGQLGLGGTGNTMVAFTTIASGVAAVAAGGDHTCAIVVNGTVKCWGTNVHGEVGDGTLQNRLVPTTVAGISDVVALALGVSHSCAMTGSGAVKCWGRNHEGQIGDGSFSVRTAPTQVQGLGSGAVGLAAGRHHTCALPSTGGVKCWGGNLSGQLGDGSNTDRASPVDVQGLTAGVASVTTGFGHTCATTYAGAVKCWGRNSDRQLADGTQVDRNSPVDATRIEAGAHRLFAGGFHTCATTRSGSLRCAGLNNEGQLGNNTDLVQTGAVGVGYYLPELLSIAAGESHTCALHWSGVVKCWGMNIHGELGDGTFTNRPRPAAVPSLLAGTLSAKKFRTCVTTPGGAAQCWGSNSNGALGNGSQTDRNVPTQVTGLTASVRTVIPGHNHSCAHMYDDTVRCWGGGNSGQLGAGNNNQSLSPVTVLGLGMVSAITAGAVQTCARVASGGVQCWGGNTLGQLGDGTNDNRNTHGPVAGFPSGVMTAAVGADHGCALNVLNGAECWGRNTDAQLGDGTLVNKTSPVPVIGLSSGLQQVVAGGYHSCALTTGGSAKCWGYNNFASLGDGTTTDRTAPVQVLGLTSGVVKLEGGDFHTCAMLASGAVQCWGSNANGQLGTGATSLPVATPAHTLIGGQWIDFLPFTRLTPGVAYPFSATASNGEPVEIDSWTPDTCTVFNNYVTGWANGICGLRARQTNAVTLPPPQMRLITIGQPPVAAPRRYFDANGNGTTDITWLDANGQAALWLMNGTAIAGSSLLLGPSSGWTVTKNTGDHNGDARSDLVWTHSDGRVALWLLDGTTVTGSGLLLGPGTGWSVKHIGDFNGDGRSDILWKHTDGSVSMWLMDGLAVVGSSIVFGPGTTWTVTHVADLDGNGTSDLVWRNVDGSVTGWLMAGIAVSSSGYIFGPGTSWMVKHTGDFDGNGTQDLLFRDAGGQLSMFLMTGITVTGSAIVYSGGAFDISHVADFNGDGRTDLLFRDPGDQVALWLMDGTAVSGSAIVFGGGGGWVVTHVGDYNADGSADLLWKDPAGQVAVWLMNGTTPGATALIFGGGGGWLASPPN